MTADLELVDGRPWPDRWRDEAEAFLGTAQRARELADTLLKEGKARDSQAAATTAGICLDKAEKARELAGGATGERRTFEAIDARLSELIAAIQRRHETIDVTSRLAALPAAREQGDQ